MPPNYFSKPEDAVAANRESVEECSILYVCENGERQAAIEWANGECSNGTQVALVPENSPHAGVLTLQPVTIDAVAVVRNFTDPSNHFLYNETDGLISVNGTALNYERSPGPRIVLVTAAVDGGRQITCEVHIVVTDRNDPPILVSAGEHRYVQEQADANTPVGEAIQVYDEDEGQEVLLKITGGNEDGFFDIEACTGQIRYLGDTELLYADHQGFNLTVTATDNGSPQVGGPMNVSGTITVNVANVNDEPVFTVFSPAMFVGENMPAGTLIRPNAEWLSVPFTDADEGDTHRWYIVNSPNAPLVINQTTGVMTTTRSLTTKMCPPTSCRSRCRTPQARS